MHINKLILYIYLVIAVLLSCLGTYHYSGSFYIYLLFSVVSNYLLYLGFNGRKIFFDTFIGLFFFLGFWLKTTVRVIFFKGEFYEPVGLFSYSPIDYDSALLVVSVGLGGLIFATLLRRRIFSYETRSKENVLLDVYEKYRTLILIVFASCFVTWSYINFDLGIYQRGEIPRTVLPYKLSGIFKWLLLFGGAAFSAVIIDCEIKRKSKSNILMVFILGIVETAFSAVSLLSRGMILNSSALFIGTYESNKKQGKKNGIKNIVISVFVFFVLFVTSVYSVNNLRRSLFYNIKNDTQITKRITQMHNGVRLLFLDRWVGIEGVLAVHSSKNYGWEVFKDALNESYVKGKLSFYDRNMIESPYRDNDLTKHNFISIPGVMAFLYYPRSILFLFFGMFIFSLFAGAIEYLVYSMCGKNLVLCSVIGQVVAYRYAHFGYTPKQSYLLFGTIILNILIIYFIRKLASFAKPNISLKSVA